MFKRRGRQWVDHPGLAGSKESLHRVFCPAAERSLGGDAGPVIVVQSRVVTVVLGYKSAEEVDVEIKEEVEGGTSSSWRVETTASEPK